MGLRLRLAAGQPIFLSEPGNSVSKPANFYRGTGNCTFEFCRLCAVAARPQERRLLYIDGTRGSLSS